MTKLWWHDYRIFVQSSSTRQSQKVVTICHHDKTISGVTGSEHLNITHSLSIETEVLLSEPLLRHHLILAYMPCCHNRRLAVTACSCAHKCMFPAVTSHCAASCRAIAVNHFEWAVWRRAVMSGTSFPLALPSPIQ